MRVRPLGHRPGSAAATWVATAPLSWRLARRQVALAGLTGAALVVSGCTSQEQGTSPQLPARAPQNPDHGLVGRALSVERAMVDRIEATVRRHANLGKGLHGALVVHRSHVQLLAGAVEGVDARGGRTRRPRVPASGGDAVAALVRAERTLEAAHVDTAVRADSGVFARVLAGMAAAAAQQAVLLGPLASAHSGGPGS